MFAVLATIYHSVYAWMDIIDKVRTRYLNSGAALLLRKLRNSLQLNSGNKATMLNKPKQGGIFYTFLAGIGKLIRKSAS